MATCDKLIIGAGFYGLYSAIRCGKRGQSVIVLERDGEPFMRASYINQARLHMGYHYPRSFSTATRSARYFQRFCEDYGYCLHKSFSQVYATSNLFSWTDAVEFRKFCRNAGIRCDAIDPSWYFNDGMCDGAFLTEEYSFDAQVLRDRLLEEISRLPNVSIHCNHTMDKVDEKGGLWHVRAGELEIETPFIMNATYAGLNEVLRDAFGNADDCFRIKYEKCEIILCSVNDRLRDVGITVMDGPFFSLMPFGLTGLHSLTSVSFTPHETCYDDLAAFPCQSLVSGECRPGCLKNCNGCPERPESAWPYMSQLARKYLKEEFGFSYLKSLYSIKPILMASEIDDSRPTVIRYHSNSPVFVSVLSGKINTVYDLDEVLDNG